jgi:hypothetical protein
VPSVWLIALGLWWNANVVSHNFIHSPFFRSRGSNAAFSVYLSLLLGFPQEMWRDRHLAHHQGKPWRARWSGRLLVEGCLILILWGLLLALSAKSFFTVYLPGYVLGLFLCQLQGHYEHARGTISHYGWLYNFIFFNDGYHREHHARPAEHWTRLPQRRSADAAASRWPAILRWLEIFSLNSLERLVLKSKWLQNSVLRNHERAFRKVLAQLPTIRTVSIIGGGLFPRTALVLQRLLPNAKLTIIDASAENLRQARCFVDGQVEFTHRFYDARQDDGGVASVDLLVIPLAFIGNREELYRRPPAPNVLVHDWLWRRRKMSAVISIPLLKRLNVVQQ